MFVELIPAGKFDAMPFGTIPALFIPGAIPESYLVQMAVLDFRMLDLQEDRLLQHSSVAIVLEAHSVAKPVSGWQAGWLNCGCC